MLIDTHAHLYDEQFQDELATQIEKGKNLGLERILLPNIDVESIAKMDKLVQDFPETCFPMMGLHPCYVKPENWKEELETIKDTLYKNPSHYIAVGEIGIDLYWDKSTLNIQQEAFVEQINWAKELNLPIVIHARDSFDELFEVLDIHNDDNLKGVFHCFSGNKEQAQKIIDYGGFKMGIGGVVTFKNSTLPEVIAQFNINHFILETDSPYLAPAPHRGKRNEPSYVQLVAEKMSSIFQVSEAEMAAATTKNAVELFGNRIA
jgi:TatD DNase family protein